MIKIQKSNKFQIPIINNPIVWFFKFGYWLLFVSCFLVIGFFSTSQSLYAQDVSLQATVDQRTVLLDSSVQLTVTVEGTQNVNPIELPEIDGFQVQYLGPSTRISVVNDHYSSSKAFIYTLYPLKVGSFQIPSLSVTVSGQTYRTDPIDIEVVADASPSTLSQGQQSANTNTGALSLKDKIFMTLSAPNQSVYLGEKVPLTIKLFIDHLTVRDIEYPQFEHTGFTVEEFKQPSQYRQVVEGIDYSVIEFKTFIYPNRVGELLLGPAKLDCNLLFRENKRKSPFGEFDSFFGDDFFGGFFNTYQKRPLTVESSDLFINVLPLPKEGQPNDFLGAVGQFAFNATVSPTDIKVGDPITLRMSVQGQGNLKAVKMPSLEPSDQFKLYDPQIKENGGVKQLEQVVIPKSDRVTEIPEIRFSYFDPKSERYREIKEGPFPLKVAKPAPGEEFKIVGSDDQQRPFVREEIGKDIVFIKDRSGPFRKTGLTLLNNKVFGLFVILVLGTWMTVFFIYKKTHRLQTDSIYARKFYAPRKARKGLAQAQRFLEQEKQKEFYDAICKVLQDYLGDKLHLPPASISAHVVAEQFHKRGKEADEILHKIKAVFDECDMIRFASAQFDTIKMDASYQNTQGIIDHFERHWR